MGSDRQGAVPSADLSQLQPLAELVRDLRRHWDEVAAIQRDMPSVERERVAGLTVDVQAALAQTRHHFALEFGPETVAALRARLESAWAVLEPLLPDGPTERSAPEPPRAIEPSRLAKNIRAVVAAGEALEMYLQPIVSLRRPHAAPVGYEALARFRVAPYEAPDVWLERASDAGLHRELELNCIHAALEHLPALPPTAYLTVNASPETLLSEEFARIVAAAPAERLVAEVTEHAVVSEYESLASTIRRLRSSGLRLAVDDAGAGFASLRHVIELRPDIIKLDIHLTRGIHGDRSREALVRSLVSFADDVGATLIAEGIESREDLMSLRELQVPFGQGFLFAEPRPAALVLRDDDRLAGSAHRGITAIQTA